MKAVFCLMTIDPDGTEQGQMLDATDDIEAFIEMFERIETIDLQGLKIPSYLVWESSDGCIGYINPDGNAAPTGKSWMAYDDNYFFENAEFRDCRCGEH